MKRFMIFPVLLLTILALSPTMALAQDDPAAILKKHHAALARGDVDAALAFYADDAVIQGGRGCTGLSPCIGKAAIRKHLEGRLKRKSRKNTLIADYPSGNVLTRRLERRDEQTRKAGVERIIGWSITGVRGGKILFRHRFREVSDPQTLRFLKWQRKQRKKRAR